MTKVTMYKASNQTNNAPAIVALLSQKYITSIDIQLQKRTYIMTLLRCYSAIRSNYPHSVNILRHQSFRTWDLIGGTGDNMNCSGL